MPIESPIHAVHEPCLHIGFLGITAYNHAEEHPNNSILWVLIHALDLFYFMG